MIVYNARDGFLSIPLKGFERSRFIDLPPGYSEVSDYDWALARGFVEDKIASGALIEEWKKIDKIELDKDKGKSFEEMLYPINVPSDDVKDSARTRVPAKITDLDHKGQRIDNVVAKTFHLDTLRAWLVVEDRAEVKSAMQKQIDGIEKGDIKG